MHFENPLSIVVLLLIVLVVFGPKRLPELGRSLGHGIRGFKDSLDGQDEEQKDAEAAPQRTLEKSEQQPVPTSSDSSSETTGGAQP